MSVSEYANTGNPHYKAACLDAMSDQARILQATLALAYEQRTANLIAVMNYGNVIEVDYVALNAQIKNRLDLT